MALPKGICKAEVLGMIADGDCLELSFLLGKSRAADRIRFLNYVAGRQRCVVATLQKIESTLSRLGETSSSMGIELDTLRVARSNLGRTYRNANEYFVKNTAPRDET